MAQEFTGMLSDFEFESDQRAYKRYFQPQTIHRLPPCSTKQYAYGEFSGSPTNNHRLEFPTY